MWSLHLVSLLHITLNLNVFCLLLTSSERDCSPGYQVFIHVNKTHLQARFVTSPLSCVIKLLSLLSLFQGMNKRPLHAEECGNEKSYHRNLQQLLQGNCITPFCNSPPAINLIRG